MYIYLIENTFAFNRWISIFKLYKYYDTSIQRIEFKLIV